MGSARLTRPILVKPSRLRMMCCAETLTHRVESAVHPGPGPCVQPQQPCCPAYRTPSLSSLHQSRPSDANSGQHPHGRLLTHSRLKVRERTSAFTEEADTSRTPAALARQLSVSHDRVIAISKIMVQSELAVQLFICHSTGSIWQIWGVARQLLDH